MPPSPTPTRLRRAARAALLLAPLLPAWPAGVLSAAAQPASEAPARAEPGDARLRGTIEAFDGDRLAIRRPGGGTVSVGVDARTRVYAVTPALARNITPESYVSVLGTPGAEPRRARAVTLYSPSERGFEAGDRPWDTVPGASLTGGWIVGLDRAGPAGAAPLRVTLAHGGGRAAFEVPAGTPVTQIAPGEKSMLEPGAAVTVFARTQPDGRPEAGTVAVGRRGAVPAL